MQIPAYADQLYQALYSLTLDKNTRSFLNILEQQNSYSAIYNASAWLSKSNYTQQIFSDTVSRFVAHNREVMLLYFNQSLTLNEIALCIVNFIYENTIILDRNKILEGLSYGDSIVETYVSKYIKSHLIYKEHMNILGFGGGNGFYEKLMANYIKEYQLAKHVDVFIFDPYQEKTTNDICFLTEFDLKNTKEKTFDIINTRWVLHHINKENRWQQFIQCSRKLSSKGLLLILEEGDFDTNLNFFQQLLYRFFLMCIDVVINMALRPEWFLSTLPIPGKNFYVDYLTEHDLKYIESKLNLPFEKSVIPIIDQKFYSQNLIAYKKI